MCGILGFIGANTDANRQLVKDLMLVLSLRGTHATGVAWAKGGATHNVTMPVPADVFFQRVGLLPFPEQIVMIGHTRYSTTGDLRFNQPLDNGDVAMVMNGVIDQRAPSHWPQKYGPYNTTNDTEIALNAAHRANRGNFGGSWAILELTGGQVLAYRNGHRPLWFGKGPDFTVVASTADALLRCYITEVKQLLPGLVYNLADGQALYRLFACENVDFQPRSLHQYPDLQCQL